MAKYVLTDTPEVDWPTFDWDAVTVYSWRHANDGGKPFVQEELDRLRGEGQPVVLWRFDAEGVPPVLMEQHNI